METQLHDDFEEFFEHSHCGFLIVSPDGKISKANSCIASWLGCRPNDLPGRNLSELFSVAGQMYYEMHLLPQLHTQGFLDQATLELAGRHHRQRVLLSAHERRDANGSLKCVHLTLSKATDRSLHELTLQNEKTNAELSLANEKSVSALREQFIAVLCHELRNPVSALMAGSSFLLSLNRDPREHAIIHTMQRSQADG